MSPTRCYTRPNGLCEQLASNEMNAVLEVVVCPHLNDLLSREVGKTKTSPQGYCNTKARVSPYSVQARGLEPEIGVAVGLEG